MCAYESEIMLYQLHFYARKRYPDLEFQPDCLKRLLDEWNIKSMRQLFDFPNEVKFAVTLPLLTTVSQGYNNRTPVINNDTPIAA